MFVAEHTAMINKQILATSGEPRPFPSPSRKRLKSGGIRVVSFSVLLPRFCRVICLQDQSMFRQEKAYVFEQSKF
jgi:hypothetical protein